MQDDLEREVERLRDKLSKKTSRNGSMNGVPPPTQSHGEDVCEICEQPGHDIFSCSLLKDDGPAKHEEELVCEDCEGRGHVAANCPHSLDVF